VEDRTIGKLGVSEIGYTELQKMFKEFKYPPLINHMHQESLVDIQKDLVHFAKESNVELISHNDPRGNVCSGP
jgi:diketogulonate reductase-like aldo/keto reductase